MFDTKSVLGVVPPAQLEVKVHGGDGEAPLTSSGQGDVGESAADVFRNRETSAEALLTSSGQGDVGATALG